MKSKILFAVIMGMITTGIISFSLLAINLGLSERFVGIWLKSWLTGYLIVIPVILLLGPQVQKAVNWALNENRR
ncbi:DUF2798 domain-containing protein [Pedobacter rhizosphaerae]|uniref:DUF2798 domain-containing protein n=1 Tax=Pedobacter rhizosphaerae TaxID=390241 RepID=A0A1H9P6F0_9SPHI|nr:DUF2798 domain-containing protein [Pedobacter rhizosphaerae]SER43768.1 Protein of unknown function [Pedobacter rhizosphaerae]